jgi:hypothetical protein
MNKRPFVQPRFDGDRFVEHTLPVEVVSDLVAYESLIVDLAKYLYLQDNPERQRVPKGFEGGFQLHIEKIEDGSSRPLLAMVMAGAIAMNSPNADYFERARDLVAESIGAPEGKLPEGFPPQFLTYFNQVGRSLRDGEKMELARTEGDPAVLTPERRKKLVLATEAVYEKEVDATGFIVETHFEKRSFHLRPSDGSRLIAVDMPERLVPDVRKLGGRERVQVTIKGIGTYDAWDKLQRIVRIDSFQIQPSEELSITFESLTALADGWLNGKGLAPDKVRLAEVLRMMIEHYPDQIPLPNIAPMSEGTLLFEWRVSGDPSVDVDLNSQSGVFHAFRQDGTEIEQQFPLGSHVDWARFASFLLKTIHK